MQEDSTPIRSDRYGVEPHCSAAVPGEGYVRRVVWIARVASLRLFTIHRNGVHVRRNTRLARPAGDALRRALHPAQGRLVEAPPSTPLPASACIRTCCKRRSIWRRSAGGSVKRIPPRPAGACRSTSKPSASRCSRLDRRDHRESANEQNVLHRKGVRSSKPRS